MAAAFSRTGSLHAQAWQLDSSVTTSAAPSYYMSVSAASPFFARDPWFDTVRARREFQEIMQEAEARHRRAAQAFRETGGKFVLRVRVLVASSVMPAELST